MLWSAAMQRTATLLLASLALACNGPRPAEESDTTQKSEQAKSGEPKPPSKPEVPKPTEPLPVRKDLLAEDLPAVPRLSAMTLTSVDAGEFEWPEGTDELAPRAAVVVRDGLLLAGQAYLGRKPRKPSPSWRWLGFVPTSGDASGTKLDAGAIRAAIADGQGNALVTGIRGEQADPRGWFAKVGGDGAIELQVDLESPSATELFDLVPGSGSDELAVVGGYVDAQGWLVSLDRAGAPRWEKFIGSYGYTQVRALARLDAQLLAIGTRGTSFGEFLLAESPADGGADPSSADVEQQKPEIEGADVHQMLRAGVDLGSAGIVALGTAKKNHIQAHDQVVAIGIDRAGAVTWSKVVPDLRVTEVHGGRAVVVAGGPGARAKFVVEVPGTDGASALALLEISADGATTVANGIADTEGWHAAGFVEGTESAIVLAYIPSDRGIRWQRLALP